MVSSIDVQAIAISDRAVVDHEAAFPLPRAGTQMIEIAAFVVDDCRHTSPPQSYAKSFVTAVNEVNSAVQRGVARLHAARSKE